MTKADTYFAIVPEWVIYNASPRALQVYCILRRHADYTQSDAETFISRRKMADIAQCHVGTIDRAVADLVALRALDVVPRYADGRQTSNLYTVRTHRGVSTDAAPGVRTDAADGVSTDAEGYTESQTTESQKTELALRAFATRKEYHDAMAYALVDGLGWERDEVTEPSWARVHKAAKQLCDIDADPSDVPRRVAVYRATMNGAAVTPNAIASNWAQLAQLPTQISKRDVERASKRHAAKTAVAQIEGGEK